jgi:hypothetical protein
MRTYNKLFFNPLENKILYTRAISMGNDMKMSELLCSASFFHCFK